MAAQSTISILSEGAGPIAADVVLVHGLRGDKLATWTKDKVCWPRDLLKDDLPDCRIMSVSLIITQSYDETAW